MIASPDEVVDGDDAERIGPCGRSKADDAYDRVANDGRHDGQDDLLQPRGASREGGQDAVRKALGKDLPPTGSCVAPEASYDNLELDAPITEQQHCF